MKLDLYITTHTQINPISKYDMQKVQAKNNRVEYLHDIWRGKNLLILVAKIALIIKPKNDKFYYIKLRTSV